MANTSKGSNKVRLQRCDANAKKQHKMKVHDGMIALGHMGRTYGCKRKMNLVES
jgi:hypothetical protein